MEKQEEKEVLQALKNSQLSEELIFQVALDMDTTSALSIVLERTTGDFTIEELVSVTAGIAMEYHDADSVLFITIDNDLTAAECIFETHRADFSPLCGTGPMYMDEYPALFEGADAGAVDGCGSERFYFCTEYPPYPLLTRFYGGKKMKPVECPYEIMLLNSQQLIIPKDYQRRLRPNRVDAIVSDFDERIANEPKVSCRNGRYYVFDGQHTIDARVAKNGGHPCPSGARFITA